MTIPNYNSSILGSPEFTRGRENMAEYFHTGIPKRLIMDSYDEALAMQCDGSHVHPHLKEKEEGADKGQIVFEISGKISMNTNRLLTFFDEDDVDQNDDVYLQIVEQSFQISARESMRALTHVASDTERQAMITLAFSKRQHELELKSERARSKGKDAVVRNIGFRRRDLEEAYREVMKYFQSYSPQLT